MESCELVFEDHRVLADAVLGGTEGQGFAQMMKGLAVGMPAGSVFMHR